MSTVVKKADRLKRHERCHTCGTPRGLSVQRKSWRLDECALVPRTGDKDHKPAQMVNDLIVYAGVYRNGSTCDETHLCDECLKVGLRLIKNEVDKLLGAIEADQDLNQELEDLTQRLGSTQHKLNNLSFDHNRMQERLGKILKKVPPSVKRKHKREFEFAQWESDRKPAERVV